MTTRKKITETLKNQASEEIKKQLKKATQKGGALSQYDQDGDGDVDKNDAMKFGMNYLMKKLLGKK